MSWQAESNAACSLAVLAFRWMCSMLSLLPFSALICISNICKWVVADACICVWHADPLYVLINYKTEPCRRPHRLCRQGYACPSYHSARDKRRSPCTHKYRSAQYDTANWTAVWFSLWHSWEVIVTSPEFYAFIQFLDRKNVFWFYY